MASATIFGDSRGSLNLSKSGMNTSDDNLKEGSSISISSKFKTFSTVVSQAGSGSSFKISTCDSKTVSFASSTKLQAFESTHSIETSSSMFETTSTASSNTLHSFVVMSATSPTSFVGNNGSSAAMQTDPWVPSVSSCMMQASGPSSVTSATNGAST